MPPFLTQLLSNIGKRHSAAFQSNDEPIGRGKGKGRAFDAKLDKIDTHSVGERPGHRTIQMS
jgi:hypothetical protein